MSSPSKYGAVADAAMNAIARTLFAATGINLSDIINDLWYFYSSTSFGATAAGPDIDSIALGGGAFSQNPSTTAGLTFGYSAGRILVGQATKTIGAGTLALSASATNYVEVDGSGAGTVSSNTSGFTLGRAPLYIVTTGVSTISTVTNAKILIETPTPAAIAGVMLSAAAATRTVATPLGTISATTTFLIPTPGFAAVLAAAVFADSTAFATDNTNYWSFRLQELGPAGSGTTDMLNTGAVNTTQTTGGSAITANVARSLALNGTPANLVTAANDFLLLTITKTGAPANLTLASLRLDFAFTV